MASLLYLMSKAPTAVNDLITGSFVMNAEHAEELMNVLPPYL